MGNCDSLSKKVNVEQIKKEIMESPVVMYSRKSCGYCTMARDLFDKEKIKFSEKDLDVIKQKTPDNYQEYVNGLVYVTRQTTVPQIFICGQFIGGYTQLNKMLENNQLLQAIAQCSDSRFSA